MSPQVHPPKSCSPRLLLLASAEFTQAQDRPTCRGLRAGPASQARRATKALRPCHRVGSRALRPGAFLATGCLPVPCSRCVAPSSRALSSTTENPQAERAMALEAPRPLQGATVACVCGARAPKRGCAPPCPAAHLHAGPRPAGSAGAWVTQASSLASSPSCFCSGTTLQAR